MSSKMENATLGTSVLVGCLFLILCVQTGCRQKSPSEDEREADRLRCPVSARCAREFCDQVLVPAGSFIMGSDQEEHGVLPPAYFGGLHTLGDPRPAHEVFLDSYCIDRYEVTVEHFEACVRAGVCDPGEVECTRAPNSMDYQTKVNHYPEKCENRGELCPNYPVNCKSYEQASTYCQWTGGRLCTEAEWERAAGGPGPEKRVYPWGCDAADATRANTSLDGPGHLMPVDSHPVGMSAEGVYNLTGNVYEWVSDFYATYHDYAGDIPVNPKGPKVGKLRVGRGGCFLTESWHTTIERTTFDPKFNWGCVGIRCCSSPLPD
jgi:formylglycine-generating enzyme required for sulfatase activity